MQIGRPAVDWSGWAGGHGETLERDDSASKQGQGMEVDVAGVLNFGAK